MKKKRGIFYLVFLILLLGMLTGCQKQEQQTTLKELKSKGKIVVGTEAAFPPFEYVEDGKIIGYGADILAEISKSLNLPVEQMDVPFTGILTSLENKKFDVIATSLSVTPERKEKFGMTTPIADFTQVLVKLKSNEEIKDLQDIDGKIIGCPAGTTAEQEMLDYSEKLKAEGKKGLQIKSYQANTDTFIDLKNGRVDLIFLVLPMANMLVKEEPETYEILTTFGAKSYMSWAVRKEDKELLQVVNDEIIKLKKSGKLQQLQEKWFGTSWDLPDQLP